METDTAFIVKHETFEGPLEVLLELIEKRKVFVNDIISKGKVIEAQTIAMEAEILGLVNEKIGE